MEHSAGPVAAPVLPHGCQDAWFREVVALDLHLTDARPRATDVWDASACARRDVAPDAAVLRLQLADAVEKWAVRARAALGQSAWRRRSEPLAAPAAEPAALEPYTPDADRFAERSCAAAREEEQMVAPALTARSLTLRA